MALQQSWAHLMQFRNRAGELRAIWELRTHMGFLVDNLQYYVQVHGIIGWCVREMILLSVKGFVILTVREIIHTTNP